MRIALDAMGGDHAPAETTKGAVEAARDDPEMTVVLVGREAAIQGVLGTLDPPRDRIVVANAEDVVKDDDNPAEAVRRKRDSSIVRCAALVREKRADAMVSAGSTGGAVAAATLVLKLMANVRRPGIGVVLPSGTSKTVMIDVGANIYCKPVHLFHYGIMGAEYVRRVLGKTNPTIGLLNIGTEDRKGNELVRETRTLYAKSSLNFIGHIEGNQVFNGACDVIVCEGFVGNVVLKVAEGLSDAFFGRLRGALASSTTSDQAVLGRLLNKFELETDYAEHGAAPLLGVNGLCMISHGRSSARAIRNALKMTARLVRSGLIEHIHAGLEDAAQRGSVPTTPEKR